MVKVEVEVWREIRVLQVARPGEKQLQEEGKRGRCLWLEVEVEVWREIRVLQVNVAPGEKQLQEEGTRGLLL